MRINGNIIEAESGYILRRKYDEQPAGEIVYLGMCYWLDGKRCEPFLELPEHYEEIEEEDNEEGAEKSTFFFLTLN